MFGIVKAILDFDCNTWYFFLIKSIIYWKSHSVE